VAALLNPASQRLAISNRSENVRNLRQCASERNPIL
jgi:hypothetical protein